MPFTMQSSAVQHFPHRLAVIADLYALGGGV